MGEFLLVGWVVCRDVVATSSFADFFYFFVDIFLCVLIFFVYLQKKKEYNCLKI